jgi:hypothetical protein
MINQKLLEFKRAESSSETNEPEPPRRIPVVQVSTEKLKSFIPNRLDLAGNRWSPLHEW